MQCDECAWLEYDDEEEEWFCSVDMDEDDVARYYEGKMRQSCPYYRNGDEYQVVKHQM